MRQINAFPHFWFAWAAFFPDTILYGFQPPTAEETDRYELDPILGDPAADVTLIEYGAYGCHACKYWHEQGIVEALLEEFDGRVNFVYGDIPIIVPQYSQIAAEIAQCALDQGNEKFWTMHDAIYTEADQGRASADELLQLGAEVGLDGDALQSCYDAGTHISRPCTMIMSAAPPLAFAAHRHLSSPAKPWWTPTRTCCGSCCKLSWTSWKTKRGCGPS